MPYTFTCDGACGDRHEELPAFMGEIRESWFKTTEPGGILADMGYAPGQTITLCGGCLLDLLDSNTEST